MSGPVSSLDTGTGDAAADDAAATTGAARVGGVEVLAGRQATVGGMPVTRLLPKRAHRTVGAWCFVDRMGPVGAGAPPLLVGPHPHIGLHTVTWLLEGEVLHRDSLGSEQPIRPGQLNLMTAGRGVAHAEEGVGGAAHGVQLWVAQPDRTRWGEPAFEHHAELPEVVLGGTRGTSSTGTSSTGTSLTGTVLVGTLAGSTSPARTDTPLVGADLAVRGAATVPLEAGFEHALVPVDGGVRIERGEPLAPGSLAYLAPGRSAVEVDGDGRLLLLGGEPFEAPVAMWWNFVARTPDELDEAAGDWAAGADRFGPVGSPLPRIDAPPRPGRPAPPA